MSVYLVNQPSYPSVLPLWTSEVEEPYVVELLEELNASDEAAMQASHPVSKQEGGEGEGGGKGQPGQCMYLYIEQWVVTMVVLVCARTGGVCVDLQRQGQSQSL